jgi:hypothetical protein
MLARLAAMRLLGPILAVAAIALAAAGCGSSSDETGTAANPPASNSTTPGGQKAPVGVRAKSCTIGRASGGVLRVTGVSCELGRSVVAGWYKDSACSSPQGASRTSCKLGKFTCLGAATDSGLAVSCAGPGRSVSFIGRPD